MHQSATSENTTFQTYENQEAGAVDIEFAPIAAVRLMALQPRERQVLRTSEGQESQVFDYDVELLNENDVSEQAEVDSSNEWVLNLKNHRRIYVRETEDGGMEVFREEDVSEQVRLEYQPAIKVMPAQVHPGTLTSGTVDVTVYNLKNGHKRDHGTCEYRVEAIERRMVQKPEQVSSGETDLTAKSTKQRPAYILREHRELDLGLADATITVETAYMPGEGRVTWEVRRETRARPVQIGAVRSL